MKEEKLLLFLALVVHLNINKCKYTAFGKNLQKLYKNSEVNGDHYSFQDSKLLKNRYIKQSMERRKRDFSEKENKEDGILELLHDEDTFSSDSETNSNTIVSSNPFKRNSIKTRQGSGHISVPENQGSPKRSITLWSLEGLSDDFPRDLNRLAPDQGEKIGDEALPSLVRNIEPTDYRAYLQYQSFSETEANDGSELEKNRDGLVVSLSKRNGMDGKNQVKKYNRNGHTFKSVSRKKKQMGIGDSYLLPVMKRKREIKKSEEKKKENIEEPFSNTAGTNELGLIEIEREQEINEEATKKEKNESDAMYGNAEKEY